MDAPPDDLAARLDDVERPKAHRLELRDRSPLSRLYATPVLHRALPAAAAVALARLRGEAEWRLVAGRRDAALRWASAVTGPEVADAERRSLARARLREAAVQTELSWRPWAARRMRLDGLEHLEAARAEGRGVVIATAHTGALLSLAHALLARGTKLYLSGGRRLHEPPLRGHDGRWTKAQNVLVEQAGGRWVGRGRSWELLRALLDRGEVVWMAWDVGGSTPVQLLGRPAWIASGTARLACATGAPVVPAFTLRDGARERGVLFPPIPAAPGEEDRVNAAVAAAFDSVVASRLPQAHASLARRFTAPSR